MIFAFFDSQSEAMDDFIGQVQSYVECEGFSNDKDLQTLLSNNEIDAVVFDYDKDHKQSEKGTKLVRAQSPHSKIIIISDLLNAKQLIKHQNSKFGADLYLRAKMKQSSIQSLLESLFDVEFDEVQDDGESIALDEMPPMPALSKSEQNIQLKIMDEHHGSAYLTDEALKISEEIDQKFNAVFPIEEDHATKMLQSIAEAEQAEARAVPDELDLGELSIDEDDINLDKEPDMSGIDETELPLDDIETLELGETDELEVLAVDEGMDLALDDVALDLSEDDDVAMVEEVVDKSELDMSADDVSLDLLEDDEQAQSIAIVTDELDLDSAQESQDLLGESDEVASLDLAADDDGLDLSDDEDVLDLSSDDEEPASEIDDSLEATLDLASEEESDLDLSSDGEDSELNLGLEEEIEDMSDGLEFGEAIDLAPEQEPEEQNTSSAFTADDLPQPPDDLDELSFGSDEPSLSGLKASDLTDNDLSFENNGEVEDFSEDVMAKLAEIDAMMDSGPVLAAQDEATGEHDFSATKHALKQLDEIEALEDSDFEEELSFDNNEEIESDTPADLEELNFGAEEQAVESELIAPPIPTPPRKKQVVESPKEHLAEHSAFVEHHNEELLRYGETIKNMRDEREELLAALQKTEEKYEALKRENIGLKSELDEKKIELSIIKKRHDKQMDEVKYQLDLSNDRKELLEEKNKQVMKENEQLSRQMKIDLTKVRAKERDLENKLEMLKADADLQIRNRDQKILELKRKIDTLQFDVESMQMQEKRTVSSNYQLEEKMEKVIRTLRRAIGELEEDGSSIRALEEIKKNLDV
jgi:hypothetical protein